MSDLSDFVIDENGVLTEYLGYDSIIDIPEGVRAIDTYVFNCMDGVERIYFPDTIERIDELNFEDCESLRYNESGGGYYLGNEREPFLVLVKAKEDIFELDIADGCRIIFANALANQESLTRLTIPESVRTVGFMAFYSCYSLRELSLPDGIEYIDSCAFYDCAIERLVLPESLTYIGFDAFNTVMLEEVTLPDGIDHIGHGAFAENDLKYNEYCGGYYIGSENSPYLCFMRPCDKNAESIALHADTRHIYSSALEGCARLRSVTLPDGLREIGCEAFRGCAALETVDIPSSVTLICENAFASCTSLAEIGFSGSEVELESGAFMDCKSLRSISLGAATVGDNAFDGCVSLESFTAGEGSNLYGDCIFADCAALTEIVLPESLRGRFSEDELDDGASTIIKFV